METAATVIPRRAAVLKVDFFMMEMLLRPPALGPSPDVVALPPAPDELEVISVSAGRAVIGGGGTGHSRARDVRGHVFHRRGVRLRYQIEINIDSHALGEAP
jgi:hypothetical protein